MKNKTRIYKVDEILEELDDAIKNRKPWSIIRLGDGGIKLIEGVLRNQNQKRLLDISDKEGIPMNKMYSVFYLWGKYARETNFIDSCDVYFNDEFWPRSINAPMIPLVRNWKKLYNDSEFITKKTRYCNPEVNFLMLLKGRYKGKGNLIDIIRGKKICCITNYPKAVEVLKKIAEVEMIKIVGFNQDHYKNCYKEVTKKIKRTANKYDLWFVGAGELGRIYSGLIKQCGGRAIDMGSTFDCWAGAGIPNRLKGYIRKISKYSIGFRLTKEGKKYKKFI